MGVNQLSTKELDNTNGEYGHVGLQAEESLDIDLTWARGVLIPEARS